MKIGRNGMKISSIALLLLITTARGQVIQLPDSLVAQGTTIEVVKSGVAFTEGPAVWSDGTLYFNELDKFNTWKVTAGGASSVIRSNNNRSNGMIFDNNGNLLVCEQARIARMTVSNGQTVTVADKCNNAALGEPNDLALDSAGGLYFTCPVWQQFTGKIYYLPPGAASGAVQLVDQGLNNPNGIECISERGLLFVAMTLDNRIVRYSSVNSGKFGGKTNFVSVFHPDGFEIDFHYNFWVVSHDSAAVVVFNWQGVRLGQIKLNETRAENCSFGWGDNSYLYIACRENVYKIKTRMKGRKGNLPVLLKSPLRLNHGETYPLSSLRPASVVNDPSFFTIGVGRSGNIINLTGKIIRKKAYAVAGSGADLH